MGHEQKSAKTFDSYLANGGASCIPNSPEQVPKISTLRFDSFRVIFSGMGIALIRNYFRLSKIQSSRFKQAPKLFDHPIDKQGMLQHRGPGQARPWGTNGN